MWIPPASRGTLIARLLSSIARPTPSPGWTLAALPTPDRQPSSLKPEEPSPHPGMIITIPGIVITMTPETPFRSIRNAHHDHFGIAITMPQNPQSTWFGPF